MIRGNARSEVASSVPELGLHWALPLVVDAVQRPERSLAGR